MMEGEGRVVKQGKFSNDPEGLEEFMDGADEALVAMEAGYCWQPLYDGLEEAGYDVRLAHPQKVKAITQAEVKTDKIDSETLAHLLRAGPLPKSYVPPRDFRGLRDRVRRARLLRPTLASGSLLPVRLSRLLWLKAFRWMLSTAKTSPFTTSCSISLWSR